MNQLSIDRLLTTLLFSWLVFAVAAPVAGQQKQQSRRGRVQEKTDNPFDGEAAMKDLIEICKIGPRISGTDGMAKQQAMLIKRFEELGAKIEKQSFEVKHPVTGKDVPITNLIVQWHPDKKKRILLCTHYDTRPLPDRDRVKPDGIFLGANDGASGCAFFLELGKHMGDLGGEYGIDFVFFDAEEFVYQRPRDPLFVGSTHFAEEYVKQKEIKYAAGILLDMIADKHLDLYYEKNSLKYAKTITQSLWETAAELKIREFVPKVRHEVRDDHLPLNTIAKIPTCDIIDFDYPTIRKKNAYWHTRMDKPDKCSGESMAKVGWVVIEWLKKVQKPVGDE